jgi:hypothetical protein
LVVYTTIDWLVLFNSIGSKLAYICNFYFECIQSSSMRQHEGIIDFTHPVKRYGIRQSCKHFFKFVNRKLKKNTTKNENILKILNETIISVHFFFVVFTINLNTSWRFKTNLFSIYYWRCHRKYLHFSVVINRFQNAQTASFTNLSIEIMVFVIIIRIFSSEQFTFSYIWIRFAENISFYQLFSWSAVHWKLPIWKIKNKPS